MLDQLQLQYFAKRRRRLLEQLEPNSVVIIPGNRELLRNGDAHYAFRQDSNFYYLTGFNEPDSLAVLTSSPENKFILFVRPRDPDREQWDGIRAGVEGAKQKYGADHSFTIDELDDVIVDLVKNKSKVYYDLGCNNEYDELVIAWLNKIKKLHRQGVSAPEKIVNIGNILSEMRLFKDEYEQSLMLKAGQISAAAHIKAMQAAKTAEYEYELEAAFLNECVKNGARLQAYNPIVGAGANSCILHYNDNNQQINKNDLVLIDAGAEYLSYAADITRTFPASGKFSTEQKAIYELVLKAQLAGIQTIKPGNTWDQTQAVMIEVITAGLVALGVIKGDSQSISTLIENKAYRPFYMHNSGHWLGLDVHDVGSYKIDQKWRKLQPGMVLTVEPGIYIQANMPNVDSKWWNIGVRIEDDVLVTATGHDILTKDVPKQVHEIEQLMA